MLMIAFLIFILGLGLGSFANAWMWRVHEQDTVSKSKNPNKKYLKNLSISQGRSMCPSCKHTLAAKDLIPVISWLWLRGKCRYCHTKISSQYPLIELLTGFLFLLSYMYWPKELGGTQIAIFTLWLATLSGLMALFVYDIRWKLLPNRIVLPLSIVAAVMAIISIVSAHKPVVALLNALMAVGVGGGIFYVLFQVSSGKWIGGGDVKLGWMLGLILATPGRSFLMIFLASVIGTLVSLPPLLAKRLDKNAHIPFGPFLIIAAIIVQLFGHSILQWYQRTFFSYMS
jgi:prepilin signal peptidase PulO-like enzyme (type II secretory pathway)